MSEFFALALSFAVGYVIGSFPTAYVLVLWKTRIDIRDAGSGNVGALNSYEVTRSRLVGILVLLVDLAKGMAAVWVTGALSGGAFEGPAAGTLGAVAGHNFPVWLKGRGGRGLATAAGAMLVLSWPWVVIWVVLWVASFLPLRRINIANAIACGAGLVLIVLAPGGWLGPVLPAGAAAWQLRIFGGALFALLLSRLVGPLAALERDQDSRELKQE